MQVTFAWCWYGNILLLSLQCDSTEAEKVTANGTVSLLLRTMLINMYFEITKRTKAN